MINLSVNDVRRSGVLSEAYEQSEPDSRVVLHLSPGQVHAWHGRINGQAADNSSSSVLLEIIKVGRTLDLVFTWTCTTSHATQF